MRADSAAVAHRPRASRFRSDGGSGLDGGSSSNGGSGLDGGSSSNGGSGFDGGSGPDCADRILLH